MVARGVFLITNGALITVDPALGVLPRADILVRDGRIEQIGGAILPPAGAEVIDATDMIVMPGFVDTHYHMWSALGCIRGGGAAARVQARSGRGGGSEKGCSVDRTLVPSTLASR
jgi:imidazolonepropionase-like amidohydrolase